jgi:hypothetical protein
VVYKVDRLTRSLADFAKMVELFDACGHGDERPSSSTRPAWRRRSLIVNQSEAETVPSGTCVRLLMEELDRRGIRSKVRVARNGKTSGGN